jgi:hypothetical protein
VPAKNKTEVISAAAFRELPAKRGRKAALPVNEMWDEQADVKAEIAAAQNMRPPDGKFRHEEIGVFARPTQASYTFTYSGPVVSGNATFAGMHWTKRKALTDKWHGIFSRLMESAGVQAMRRFRINLAYNSRHDCDNLMLICKWLADTVKGKYVADDSKKYYRGINIEPKDSLPHNTFVFTLIEQP